MSNKRVSNSSITPVERENGKLYKMDAEIGWSQSSQGFVCYAVFFSFWKGFKRESENKLIIFELI